MYIDEETLIFLYKEFDAITLLFELSDNSLITSNITNNVYDSEQEEFDTIEEYVNENKINLDEFYNLYPKVNRVILSRIQKKYPMIDNIYYKIFLKDRENNYIDYNKI